MINHVLQTLAKKKEHCQNIILRIINSRGVCSHDFLASMFLFAVTHVFPQIDITEVESHSKLYSFISKLLQDMKRDGLLGISEVDSPLMVFDENKSCVHLTFTGAWLAWLAIKNYPTDTVVEYCFACQIECSMDDIYFIDHELYYTMNIAHGPFFNYFDPCDPNSQEVTFDMGK